MSNQLLAFEQVHADIMHMIQYERYHNREVNSILIGYDQRQCILASQKCHEQHLYWPSYSTADGQAKYYGIPVYVVDKDDHLSVGYQSTDKYQRIEP